MNAKSLFTLSFAAFAALAATGAPALAADTAGNSTVVHTSDLNLATPEGIATLNRRIAYAAEAVCRQADGPSLNDRARYDACRATALASASPKLNAVIASARSDHRDAMNGGAIAMLGR